MSFEWVSETPRSRRSISARLRRVVAERDKGRCRYCGRFLFDPLDDDAPTPHLDHVLPVDLGGATHSDNLVLSCPSCNMAKGGAVWRPLPIGAVAGPLFPRPPSYNETHVRATYHLSLELQEAVNRAAAESGRSKSKVVEDALRQHLKLKG